jgi:uncharacterized protein (DUF1501 family)
MEFGRTARVNGTNGTDHRIGTVALFAGGAFAADEKILPDSGALAPISGLMV